MNQWPDEFLHGSVDLTMRFGASAKKSSFCLMDRQLVERGFSVNKEVETCNMKEDTPCIPMCILSTLSALNSIEKYYYHIECRMDSMHIGTQSQ